MALAVDLRSRGRGYSPRQLLVGRGDRQRSRDPYALAVSDLDADGKIDVVVGNVASPSTVYFNDGSGRHYTPVRFGDSEGVAFGLAIADLDGNGLLDIAVARSNATNVVCFAD